MNAQAIVEEALELSGVSKSELARRSGISRSSLDEYLQGKRQPSVAQLERLGESAGLHLEINWTPIQVEVRKDPSWTRPNPSMNPRPLTIEERAQVLEQVVPIAVLLRRRERGALEFPPFRSVLAQ